MTLPSSEQIDIIATKILFDAKEAILMLKAWNNSITESAEKVRFIKELIGATAKQMNGDFKGATAAVNQFSKALGVNSAVVRQVGKDLRTTGETGEAAGKKMHSGFERALTGVNALRIAMGVLVSMLIFQVIQAFQSMVQGALKGLTEIEAATFNIVNAEKRLSEQGVEITVKGLDKLIKELQILDPMLSKFQATELISTLTTKVAPALRLNQTEIERLAKSITILSVRNQALGKSFEEVETQVITGLLSGRVTSGINQLGVKITDQIVQEESLRLGLVKSTEAYSALNAKEKERIDALSIISILEQNTAQEAENLPEFLKTASGLIGVAKAEFQDLLTSIGQTFAPLIKSVFKIVIGVLENINEWLEKNKDTLQVLSASLGILLEKLSESGALEAFFKFLFLGLNALIVGFTRLIEVIDSIIKRTPFLSRIAGKLLGGTPLDTPTGQFVPDVSGQTEGEAKESQKAMEKLRDIVKDNFEKLVDIEEKYRQKLQDIAKDYSNKLADIARETAQKREDAARNYSEKVEDINRDTNEKIAEAQVDYRKKEIDREAEFQRRLRELREKFLFDLEDALRERDARQVLRLIRQYQMDKKSLEERRKLDANEGKKDLAQKIADLERERQLKLEAAKREYDEKLEEIAIGERRALQEARIWQQRQLQEARIWHQRQLEEQRQYLQRKLEDLRKAYEQELKMAGAYSDAINNALSTAGSTTSPTTTTNPLSGGVSTGGSSIGIGSGLFNPYDVRSRRGYAEGGTVVATKPTRAIFGERGPEVASFTPLGKTGRDVNKLFGDMSKDTGGFINIAMSLSPDLEARVVETSLENVAVHLERIVR